MDPCFLSKPDVPLLDLCDWYVFYIHATCTPFEFRAAVYRQQGVWFMDDDGECHIASAGRGSPLECSLCCDAPLAAFAPASTLDREIRGTALFLCLQGVPPGTPRHR